MNYMHTCPVCKEKFYPAPMHVYKTTPQSEKLVCSYHCMIKYRREKEEKKQRKRRFEYEN